MSTRRTLQTLLPRAQRAAAAAALPAPATRPSIAIAFSRQYHDAQSQTLQGPLYKHLTTTTTTTTQKPTSTPTLQKRAYSSNPPADHPPSSKIYDFSSLQKLIANPSPKITIIDSREPGELAQTGHIPSAINIPVTTSPDSFFISPEEFEDRFGFPRPPKDQELIFYCKAGVRSRAAAQLARQAGWEKVGEYPGSWLDWFEKGGPVERS
ncbi:Rhodanese-like domain-containing protein [Cercophora samala]|uniref:Rhodanese-like domain-containing protein n=1 Tax=Cercophora samala TaxID=330535 RepID=A0AA39ZHB3_9PEZI|nr:Rhodanese-like domain-containing protein [Cercophora samala]